MKCLQFLILGDYIEMVEIILFKKKRYKHSSGKFIKRRIRLKFKILTFDHVSSPGHSMTSMYFNGMENRIDVKINIRN